MLWLSVGPTGIYLLDFFCSGIQFYLLLSPYHCFINTRSKHEHYVVRNTILRESRIKVLYVCIYYILKRLNEHFMYR